MEQTIWKYTVPFGDTADVEMPQDAKILHVEIQHNHLRLWAMVDPRRDTVLRRINLAGTGHDLSNRIMGEYIGTFQLAGGNLIFHAFDGGVI